MPKQPRRNTRCWWCRVILWNGNDMGKRWRFLCHRLVTLMLFGLLEAAEKTLKKLGEIKLRFKGRNQNTLWWVGMFTIPNGPGLCPSNYYCVSLLDTTRSLFQLRLSNIIEAGTLCTWHHQQQAGLDIWFWEAISVSDLGVEQHSCDSTFGVCCSSALKHHLRETSAIHFDPANVGPQKKMVPGRRSFPFGDCIFGKGYDHVSTFIQLPNHGPIPTWYT